MRQSFEDHFGAAPDIRSWLYADVWLREARVRRGPLGMPQQLFFYERPSIGEPGLYLPLSLSWGIVGSPITGAASGTNNVGSTLYGDTTAGNLALMYIGQYGAASALAVPDDDLSSAWTALTAVDSGGGNRAYGRWWYVPSLTGGATQHFSTKTGSGSFCSMVVYVLSGSIGASPFDVENHASTAGAATLPNGTVTPTAGTYAAFTGLTFTASATPAIDSGFALGPTTNFGAGTNDGVAAAHKLGSLSATEAPIWSAFASSEAAAAIAVFKVGASSSSPTVGFETILRQAAKRASFY